MTGDPHTLSQFVLRHGKDEPPPTAVPLRAGPLTLIYQAGDLRYVKLGGREVIRRIYAAVRDRNWRTIAPVLRDERLELLDGSFRITYEAEHREGEIHFAWTGEISGDADGMVRFTFDGEARSTFLKNRIGFCVLHPIRECAGATCRVRYASGDSATIRFPLRIAPEQPVAGLHDLAAMAHEVHPGVWAELEFEGDAFETEDQRNWIDASFKTFCTPLRIPFPVEIKAGTRVRQSVTLRLASTEPVSPGQPHSSPVPRQEERLMSRSIEVESKKPQRIVAVELGSASRRVPSMGLGSQSHDYLSHEFQVKRLHALKPAHYRLDLSIGKPTWPGMLWLGKSNALDVGAKLELALHFPNVSPVAMKEVSRALAKAASEIARVVVFLDGQKSTPERLLKLARKHLETALPEVPLGAGTNADLYQLNLQRPPDAGADFICWSMNPQVHAFDDASIAETPEAAACQVRSVREYFPDKPLAVSPVTLKPRFNPDATGPQPPVPPGELPPQVDPRQMSLFGAVWTMAMIKQLCETGADSVTFFETTGWRGVMETAAGSRLPNKFQSIPGGVFPLYHVFADLAPFARGEVVASNSADSLAVQTLALRYRRKYRLLLSNMTAVLQTVSLVDPGHPVSVKRLNETNAELALREPERWRAEPATLVPPSATLRFELMPYEVARVDWQV